MVSGYLMTRVSCSGFRLRVWVLEGTFGVCWEGRGLRTEIRGVVISAENTWL